jgi:AraC-like DNA-binding protein
MFVPTNYLTNIVEFAVSRGASRDRILRGAGLTRAILEDPEARIPAEQFMAIVQGAIDHSGQPALMLQLGSQLRVTSHGILGYAAMSSATLAEALRLATKYVQTRTPLLVANVEVGEGISVLHVDEAAVLTEGRRGLLELCVGALSSVAAFLTGDRFRVRRLLLPYPEPPYIAEYRKLFDCTIVFDSEAAEIHFFTNLLEMKLPFADEAAKKLAAQRCEEELAAIAASDDIENQVRARLLKASAGMPSLDEVARQLGLSPRTLRRRLKALDTSYQKILSNVREELAVQYLRTTDMTVCQIADRLGYSDQSNFGRAFKGWTGRAPQKFRDPD